MGTRVFSTKTETAFMGAGANSATRISDFDGDIGLNGGEDGLLAWHDCISSTGKMPPIGSFGKNGRRARANPKGGTE